MKKYDVNTIFKFLKKSHPFINQKKAKIQIESDEIVYPYFDAGKPVNNSNEVIALIDFFEKKYFKKIKSIKRKIEKEGFDAQVHVIGTDEGKVSLLIFDNFHNKIDLGVDYPRIGYTKIKRN